MTCLFIQTALQQPDRDTEWSERNRISVESNSSRSRIDSISIRPKFESYWNSIDVKKTFLRF